MDVCRVCLSSKAEKDVSQLRLPRKYEAKNYNDVWLFCFGIQVIEDNKSSRKLCVKCFKKIIGFHKFKSLALRNDVYWKSLLEVELKLKPVKEEVKEENEAEIEFTVPETECTVPETECTLSESNESQLVVVKEETETKYIDEDVYESDDELLSVIQKIKYEYITEDVDNDNVDNIDKERIQECDIENVNGNTIRRKGTKKTGRTRRKGSKVLKIKQDKERIKEVCEECGQSVWNIKEHARRHMPLSERKYIKCKDCDKMFSTYGSRYKHYKTKHLLIKQRCEICSKEVVNLKYHHLMVHNTKALPYGCVLCDRRFISKSIRAEHMTLHTKDRPHECDVCKKKFRSKLGLRHHIRQVHEKEKTHICQFCSKAFFKKYHLQLHLRSHTKEKPYECPECGKWFSTTTILRSHQLIHSDVKTFECSYCDSKFTKPGYLRVHIRTHTKEKRHPCKYCGVQFGRSDHRKRHEFTAHEKHLLSTAA